MSVGVAGGGKVLIVSAWQNVKRTSRHLRGRHQVVEDVKKSNRQGERERGVIGWW